MLSPEGRICSWNKGAQTIKGYQPDEILGKSFEVLYLPEDVKEGLPAMLLEEACKNGRVEHEGWRLKKDGTRFWADVIITALRDENGSLLGFSKITRDLSNRRMVTEELRQSETRFRLLIDSVHDYAIYMLDTEGNVATWNEGAQRIKGYTAQEILGKPFSLFYPEEGRQKGLPEKELELALQNRRYEEEGWRVRKDGKLIWVNVVLTPVFDNTGTHVGFAKVTRDLTERRAAEKELHQSEERFRLMIEGVQDYAIFMLNPTGHITTWNAGAERIKGYTAEEAIGKHFSMFYPSETAVLKFPDYELKMARELGQFHDEGWRLRKDGTKIWANVVITAIRDGKGELIGFSKVTRDLTQRRIVEEKMKFLNENLEKLVEVRTEEALRAKKEAETANERKSQFLANISHELRSPLNAVIGYTEMTLMGHAGELNERQKQYLERATTSARHLLAVVDDLLDIAKIESGQLTIFPEGIELEHFIQEIKQTIEMVENKKRVSVLYEVSPELKVITADRKRLKQIFLNLISNAIKYNKPDGSVTVKLSQSYEHPMLMKVEVIDTGIGIPEDKLGELGQPFYQVNASLSRTEEGNGLGLNITKNLIKMHGGTMDIKSKVNMGTTVCLTLPLTSV